MILFCSIRRDGKTLGEMAREEVSKRGGFIAQLAVLAIMVILLASSRWCGERAEVFALGDIYVGDDDSYRDAAWRVSAIFAAGPSSGSVVDRRGVGIVRGGGRPVGRGFAFVGACVHDLSGMPLAAAIIVYAFAASALPVWLLLAPRDYLSAFIKAGAIFSLAAGILFVRPQRADAAVDAIYRRQRAGFRRQDFSVLFHHHCVRSDQRISLADFVRHDAENDPARSHARFIGYGAMLLESFVGVMAMVAACAMTRAFTSRSTVRRRSWEQPRKPRRRRSPVGASARRRKR